MLTENWECQSRFNKRQKAGSVSADFVDHVHKDGYSLVLGGYSLIELQQ